MIKEQIPKPEEKLTPEDKERLAELGAKRLKEGNFYGARIMFEQAGSSEEELKPLLEAEKFLKEQPPREEVREGVEPTSETKKAIKKVYKEMIGKAKRKKEKGKVKFYKDGLKALKKSKKKR